jgi:DNA-binding protein H-NS
MTREEAITEVQKLIQEHGLSLKDYQPSPLKGKKLPAKFFGPNGEKWTGRGGKPKWMRNQL